MAKINNSTQSAQVLFISLLYAKICHYEEQQKLQVGPGGLAGGSSPRRPMNDVERMQKLQNGPGGLSNGNSPARNPAKRGSVAGRPMIPPVETLKKVATALVDEHELENEAMAAFGQGQKKEKRPAPLFEQFGGSENNPEPLFEQFGGRKSAA